MHFLDYQLWCFCAVEPIGITYICLSKYTHTWGSFKKFMVQNFDIHVCFGYKSLFCVNYLMNRWLAGLGKQADPKICSSRVGAEGRAVLVWIVLVWRPTDCRPKKNRYSSLSWKAGKNGCLRRVRRNTLLSGRRSVLLFCSDLNGWGLPTCRRAVCSSQPINFNMKCIPEHPPGNSQNNV